MIRILRIAGIAVVLPVLFATSQRISEMRGNEQVPGLSYALGVLAVLFLIRAFVTEHMRGPEANFQKDLTWGLAAGAIATIISRFFT